MINAQPAGPAAWTTLVILLVGVPVTAIGFLGTIVTFTALAGDAPSFKSSPTTTSYPPTVSPRATYSTRMATTRMVPPAPPTIIDEPYHDLPDVQPTHIDPPVAPQPSKTELDRRIPGKRGQKTIFKAVPPSTEPQPQKLRESE